MGYYIHPHSVMKVAEHLNLMLQLTGDNEIAFKTNVPRTLFYNLRQGLKAAKELEFPEYKDLDDRVTLRYKDNSVIAAVKVKAHVEAKLEVKPIVITYFTSSADTILDVIDVMSKTKHEAVYFPAMTSTERVFTWAKSQGYEVTLHDVRGIIVRKTNGESQSSEGSGI